VKDVVSFSLYDLHAAGLIELYWTPEIEAEYIEHRGRLRAKSNNKEPSVGDLMWASSRIETIKQHLVKYSTPPGWILEETLGDLSGRSKYAALQAMSDKDDIHVATAAGYLAEKLGRAVILVSDNVVDLPQKLLSPLRVVLMHQGVLLEFLYAANRAAVSASLLNTAKDFKEPPIPPEKMIWSIESQNQFYNPELARRLAKTWNVPYTQAGDKGKSGAKRARPEKLASKTTTRK
jgi:hypothetical protein